MSRCGGGGGVRGIAPYPAKNNCIIQSIAGQLLMPKITRCALASTTLPPFLNPLHPPPHPPAILFSPSPPFSSHPSSPVHILLIPFPQFILIQPSPIFSSSLFAFHLHLTPPPFFPHLLLYTPHLNFFTHFPLSSSHLLFILHLLLTLSLPPFHLIHPLPAFFFSVLSPSLFWPLFTPSSSSHPTLPPFSSHVPSLSPKHLLYKSAPIFFSSLSARLFFPSLYFPSNIFHTSQPPIFFSSSSSPHLLSALCPHILIYCLIPPSSPPISLSPSSYIPLSATHLSHVTSLTTACRGSVDLMQFICMHAGCSSGASLFG